MRRHALAVAFCLFAVVATASVSSRYRTPGIIGGMGPAATCDLMQKVIDSTDAVDDQHNIHLLVDQNTDVPDRTAAILKGGTDPMPELPIAFERLGYKEGFVDPTLVLARAIVREAGAPLRK